MYLVRRIHRIPNFRLGEIEVSKAILGCDCFISWLYQDGSSPFRRPDGNLDATKVLDVMKTCVDLGVTGIDVSPPLVDVFKKLQHIAGGKIVGFGATQEWLCKSFSLDDVALQNYCEEIKATVGSRLPRKYLEDLVRSKRTETNFARASLIPERPAEPLTKPQIDRIRIEPQSFERKLELYRQLDLKLVQFGGGTADWLAGIGRTDLLAHLCELIKNRGFKPILICHWVSIVLPAAEKELDAAGYIIPLNKLWSLLSLPQVLDVIKSIEKPVIAMKTLAQGNLAGDLQVAFSFVFKKAKVEAAMIGVSSQFEARQTFSTIARILNE
jgi:hypothetical protein